MIALPFLCIKLIFVSQSKKNYSPWLKKDFQSPLSPTEWLNYGIQAGSNYSCGIFWSFPKILHTPAKKKINYVIIKGLFLILYQKYIF